MIQIYDKNNINYSFNGDMPLTPTKCTLKVELNGVCQIELEHPLDQEGRWKYIKEDNVIAVPTPWSSKQLFRIYGKTKAMTGIRTYARHIVFDLINYTLLDVRPTLKNGQEALDIILQGTPFTGRSNIVKTNTAYYVRKNILEALASDDENSFVNRWGGERYFDNYNLYVDEKIGQDKGVRAEFGYNLKEIEEDVNLDEVVTRIIPTGYNGIMLDGATPWVDSPNINKYANIKSRVINFEDIKVKEKVEDEEGYNTIEEARQAMIQRCNKLFSEGIDQPRVNYKVQMEDLSKTTLYKEFKNLESVSLGDTVTCRHNGIEIDIKARCIALEWDCLAEKSIEIELGNFEENYFNNQSDITNRIDNILNSVVDPKGNLMAEKIKGFIDSTKTILKAQRDIAEKQQTRAILFEDLVPSSPTYGCLAIGTQGIEISRTRTADGKDWDFSTAITAEGIIADKIVGNLFASKDGSTTIDMNTGEFKALQPDGSKIVISPQNGFYNQFGTSKMEYHHLTFSQKIQLTSADVPAGWGVALKTIQLPNEFKGKNFNANLSLNEITHPSGGDLWYLIQTTSRIDSIDYANVTITIAGSVDWIKEGTPRVAESTYPTLLLNVIA